MPQEFYDPYFELATVEVLNNDELFNAKMHELEILKESDSPKEIEFFSALFKEMLTLFYPAFSQRRIRFFLTRCFLVRSQN